MGASEIKYFRCSQALSGQVVVVSVLNTKLTLCEVMIYPNVLIEA